MAEEEGGGGVKLIKDGGLLQILTSIALGMGAIAGIIKAYDVISPRAPDVTADDIGSAVIGMILSMAIECIRFAVLGGYFAIVRRAYQGALTCFLAYMYYYKAPPPPPSWKSQAIFWIVCISVIGLWDKICDRLRAAQTSSAGQGD